MDFNGLWLEYSVEGNSNYIARKGRMEAVLEDNGLKSSIVMFISPLQRMLHYLTLGKRR